MAPTRDIYSSNEAEQDARIKNLEDELARLTNRFWLRRGEGEGGDYVFLDEIEITGDGDEPIDFTGIDQTYRHLVIESSLRTDLTYTDFTLQIYTDPSGLHEYANWIQHWYFSDDNPSIPVAERGSEDLARAKKVIPLPVIEGDSNSYASVTLKFPYYSKTDRAKGVLWQIVGYNVEDTLHAPAYSTGGAVWHNAVANDLEPINRIYLDTDGDNFSAGSIAGLYGIR